MIHVGIVKDKLEFPKFTQCAVMRPPLNLPARVGICYDVLE